MPIAIILNIQYSNNIAGSGNMENSQKRQIISDPALFLISQNAYSRK
jgi:hypothetical protein